MSNRCETSHQYEIPQSLRSCRNDNKMKLKVCGMKYQDNMSQVASLQPDYLGFIFYDKSSRFFDGDIPKLPENINKTGVFVNASIEDVLRTIKKYNLKAVQLHGSETPEFCKKLKPVNVKVVKVFSIKDEFDFDILKPYEEVCDYYLFDTKGKLPGGNGYAFNWNVLSDYPSTKPFFLSGGIGLDQIEKLKEFKKSKVSKYCFAIDVNSRFETKPGLKHIEDLKEFKTKLLL